MTAGSIRDARFALRSAHYDAALQLLEGCEDWEPATAEDGVVLKAETLGRRDPLAALEYLIGTDDVFTTDAGRFARDVEAGRLYASVRDFPSAKARFEAARALASTVRDGPATMAFHDLRMSWFRRECNPDAPEISVALGHSDASIAAAVYTIRAWMHASNGDYRAQVVDLKRSLACEPHGDDPIDVYTAAVTLHALARVSFETADEEGILAAQQSLALLAWTPDGFVHARSVRPRAMDVQRSPGVRAVRRLARHGASGSRLRCAHRSQRDLGTRRAR